MKFISSLRQRLDALAVPVPVAQRRYAVAFSGGLDSSVLLTAMSQALGTVAAAQSDSGANAALPLRALHVDHGLHPDSLHWAEHGRRFAAALRVPYHSERVDVDRSGGLGLEAAARHARYRALAALLQADEILVTAHHADDQLETLLMRMLRGTGVRGLRGISECERFAPGYLARPLLGFTRAELVAFADQAGIGQWVEDPANRDDRHDRSYVRQAVMPQLTARWPAAAVNAARLAQRMSQTEDLLAEVAACDAAAAGGMPMACEAIKALTPARRSNLLRYLIRAAGLPTPDARQLAKINEALYVERADARTQVDWPGAQARIWRGHLYLGAPLPASPPGYSGTLAPQRPWQGPEGCVRLLPAGANATHGLPDALVRDGLSIRFRCGGERFRPFGSAHHRPLKKWLQDAGVLPWMRDRIPLVFAGDRLVAVAGLAISAQDAVPAGAQRPWTVHFDDHPQLTATG